MKDNFTLLGYLSKIYFSFLIFHFSCVTSYFLLQLTGDDPNSSKLIDCVIIGYKLFPGILLRIFIDHRIKNPLTEFSVCNQLMMVDILYQQHSVTFLLDSLNIFLYLIIFIPSFKLIFLCYRYSINPSFLFIFFTQLLLRPSLKNKATVEKT